MPLSIAALLTSVLFFLFGASLQGILLPVRGELELFSAEQIGLLSSGWSVGFVLSCLFVSPVVRRVGHIRSFAALAAIAGAASLLLMSWVDPTGWILLRVVIGFCYGGVIMIIESWLNEKSTSQHRGVIFSTYMVVNLLASVGGNLGLIVFDPRTNAPFIGMAIAIVLSLVPLALTRSPAPAPVGAYAIDVRRLYRLSPIGVMGCFLVGLVNGAIGGLVAVFGLSSNLSTPEVSIMIAASVIGGAAAYYPIGKLSDRIDRRQVLIGVATFGIIVSMALAVPGRFLPSASVIALLGLFGVAQFPLYGLCVAHVNDVAGGQSFCETASELLLVYGIGTILGPVIAAPLMTELGSWSLFLFTGGVFTVLVTFAAWRLKVSTSPTPEQKVEVHPFAIVVTTPEVLTLDPRAESPNEEASAA